MTTLSDALARVPNPLAAHTVSDGDVDSGWVDVAALHDAARQVLWQGCEWARRGHSQVLALVGEAGSGKSHLMLWLRQQLALHGDPQTYFIAMPALPDLAQPFRHTLRQLVGALCRKESTLGQAGPGDSGLLDRPIDVLLWGALYNQAYDLLDAARVGMYQVPAALLKLLGPMCHDAGRKRRLEDFVAAAQKVWPQVEPGLRSYLLSLPTEMSIDSAARAVLLQFPYADRRGLCTAWLAGEELAQKDRERLAAKQVINNENAAKYVLGSVVRLLTAAPGAQLILHYDQTEKLAEQLGQPGMQAMAEVAAAIQSCGGSSLQVLCLQPAGFAQLHDRPTRPATGPGTLRHIDQTVRLAATTPQELRDLVTARLAAGLAEAEQRPSELYPLTEADLDLSRWPKEATTPRAALQVFAKRYSQRLRELSPGGSASARNAVSSPNRSKDAPSVPGTKRGAPSTRSPSFDFLSNEETGDALVAAPLPDRPQLDAKPRSMTHPDHSGPAVAPPKAAQGRPPAAFMEDSSPTVQALPKELLAAALVPSTARARDLAREAKLSPEFIADSSPTVQALSNDVMGRVRGAAAASKNAPLPPAKAPAAAPPATRNSGTGENVVMGRVLGPAKPGAKAADSAPVAKELPADKLVDKPTNKPADKPAGKSADKPADKPAGKSADKPADKLADKPADKLADKPADKSADKPVSTLAIPTAIKTSDGGLLVTRKTDVSAIPDFEADSSPTLKRMPDESLIKASRDGSRPHSSLLVSRVAPGGQVDSGIIGRATPTMQAHSSLIHATRPSTAPVSKPIPADQMVTKPPVVKPPVVIDAAPAVKPAVGKTLPPAKPPVVELAPAPVSNVPDPLPPSSESPSMGWLAMANDENPLADAIKQAKQDLAAAPATKVPAALAEPPRPTPGVVPPASPGGSPAAPKSGPVPARPASSQPVAASPSASGRAVVPAPVVKPSPPPVAKSAPIPPTAVAPADNIPTELPPSAESPSMGWLAMASGSSQLDDAIAQAKSDIGAPKPPESGPAARAARPMRGDAGLGVVVVNPSTVRTPELPPEPAAANRAPVRSTQARMPAIQLRTAHSVSPQQVLSALAARGMMEDWQLAQEVGLLPDALEKILVAMEEEGQLRLMAMGDGQRMVVLID